MAKPARSDEDVRSLWEAYARSHDEEIRVRLIEHYMPLAKIVAAKMFGLRIDQSVDFDDYLQYARVGLMEALDRYDIGRNTAFESYAGLRIRGAILNGLDTESELAAQRDFWRSRDRDRLESVVAGRAVKPEHTSSQDLIDITVSLALGILLEDDEGDPIDDSPQSNPYAATELEQMSGLLRSLVLRLPEREQQVIRAHYFEHTEFRLIAERHSITKGRVSQIHARGLERLKQLLKEGPTIDRKL